MTVMRSRSGPNDVMYVKFPCRSLAMKSVFLVTWPRNVD